MLARHLAQVAWLSVCELQKPCRAHVVGALLGGQHGEQALPGEWRRKATKFMDVKQMVHVIIVQRTKFVPFHINRDPAQQSQAQ